MVADDAEVDTLTDNDLQSEIELVGELVVAASASDGPLSQDELDRALGVRPDGVQVPEPESQAKGHVAP
jgi:hypothetical protein